VPKTQFNVKIEQRLQNDFRRACSFDSDPETGRSKRIGDVLEALMDRYISDVFKRRDVGRELERLKKG